MSIRSAIILIIYYFFYYASIAQATVSLDFGWKAEQVLKNNEKVTIKHSNDGLMFLWRDVLDLSQDNVSVVYSNSFMLKENDVENSFVIIVPQSWLPYKIFINEKELLSQFSRSNVKPDIFKSEIIPVPLDYLQLNNSNSIKIESSGQVLLGGFRERAMLLTNSKDIIFKQQIVNLFRNDAHLFFAAVCVLVFILAMIFGLFFEERRLAFLNLAIGSLAFVPYTLLSTSLYSTFVTNGERSFLLNLSMQFLSWPCFASFVLNLQQTEIKNPAIKFLSSKKSLLANIFASFGLICLSFFINFKTFQSIVLATFLFPLLMVPLLLKYTYQNKPLWVATLISSLSSISNLASDIFGLNYYYSAYGIVAFIATGFVVIVVDNFHVSLSAKTLAQIVRSFLPKSIYSSIEELVLSGSDIESVKGRVHRYSTSSIVFVDLCDWGVMNDQLPRTVVMDARDFVFEYIGTTFEKYGLELVKTIGDNMHFVCGLNKSYAKNDIEISNNTLSAIVELLDSLDSMAAQLVQRQLPIIKVKISATLGTNSHALEGYRGSLRFDMQGHWVNVAKRFEESMNSDFYAKYGRNSALVSRALITLCSDLNLRSRFQEPFTATDKHGQRFDGYIGRQSASGLNTTDFVQALYGQFGSIADKSNENKEAS